MLKNIFSVLLLALLGVPVLAQDGPPPPPPPEIDGEIFAEGFNWPQGVYVDAEDNVWVTDSGAGGEDEIQFANPNTYAIETASLGNTGRIVRISPDGEQEVMTDAISVVVSGEPIGPARVTMLDGTAYAVAGIWFGNLGEKPDPYHGSIIEIGDGGYEVIADVFGIEAELNPDGVEIIETHPWDLTVGPDGMFYVVDAAANAIWRFDPETGEGELVTVFDPLPGVIPNAAYNGRLLAQAVPTALVFDEEETAYVSYLSGAPFVPGTAKVVTVDLETGEYEDFALGLTMLTDLAFGADGNLYATTFGVFGLLGPRPNSGMVTRIFPDGSSEVVVTGLPGVTSIDFDSEGAGYVVINGGFAAPYTGTVVKYADLLDRPGIEME